MSSKKNVNGLTVSIGHHFIERFNSRFKPQPDIIAYLNKTLQRAIVTPDPQYKGLYFPEAGMYVPVVMDDTQTLFAKTILFRAFGYTKQPIRLKEKSIVWGLKA